MNIRTLIIATAMLVTTLTAPSSAAFFNEFKMVGASGSTTTQASFNLTDTPYLYYKVSPAVNAMVFTFWTSPDNVISSVYDITTKTPADGEGWLKLSDWDTLSDSSKLGTWKVSGFLQQGSRLADCRTTSFVVTPEPVSMILYGLGGLPIAAHLLRRRKVAA